MSNIGNGLLTLKYSRERQIAVLSYNTTMVRGIGDNFGVTSSAKGLCTAPVGSQAELFHPQPWTSHVSIAVHEIDLDTLTQKVFDVFHAGSAERIACGIEHVVLEQIRLAGHVDWNAKFSLHPFLVKEGLAVEGRRRIGH